MWRWTVVTTILLLPVFYLESMPRAMEEGLVYSFFEMVISLGNTFANIERDSFQSSIKKCHDLLKEQGSLFIQVLNYKMILKEKKRIVNITESD